MSISKYNKISDISNEKLIEIINESIDNILDNELQKITSKDFISSTKSNKDILVYDPFESLMTNDSLEEYNEEYIIADSE